MKAKYNKFQSFHHLLAVCLLLEKGVFTENWPWFWESLIKISIPFHLLCVLICNHIQKNLLMK